MKETMLTVDTANIRADPCRLRGPASSPRHVWEEDEHCPRELSGAGSPSRIEILQVPQLGLRIELRAALRTRVAPRASPRAPRTQLGLPQGPGRAREGLSSQSEAAGVQPAVRRGVTARLRSSRNIPETAHFVKRTAKN